MNNKYHNSPQAALWTPRGRGAVATIRVRGDGQQIDNSSPKIFRAASGSAVAQQPVGDILFGHWGTEASEEVVLCRLAEDQLAIHCHGGEVASQQILNDLVNCGIEIVEWSQFISNDEGTFAAEMLEALSKTKTVRTANIVLQQQTGLLQKEIERLLNLPRKREQQQKEVVVELNRLLQWSSFGLHLTTPWKVVIAGRPNVGKSSLINKLAGYERAIVFDQPGTTRDVVHVETVFDGWSFQLIDTAGIREEAVSLEQAGIERSLETLQQADCQVIVLDRSQPMLDEEIHFLKQHPTAIVVANKSDLPAAWHLQELSVDNILPLSAITGEGTETLSNKIVQQLVPKVPPSHTPLPVTTRQIEHLLQALHHVQNHEIDKVQSALKNILRQGVAE